MSLRRIIKVLWGGVLERTGVSCSVEKSHCSVGRSK